MLDDDGYRAEDRAGAYGHTRWQPGVVVRDTDEVDAEVLGLLDGAGVDWKRTDQAGQTLLHVVAARAMERAVWRCGFLLDKGVDPCVKDAEGRTALDIAVACRKRKVVEVLEKG